MVYLRVYCLRLYNNKHRVFNIGFYNAKVYNIWFDNVGEPWYFTKSDATPMGSSTLFINLGFV